MEDQISVKDRILAMDIKIVYICFLFLVVISFNLFSDDNYTFFSSSVKDKEYIGLIYFALMTVVILKYRNRWTIMFFTYAAIMITPVVGMVLTVLSLFMGLLFAAFPFLFLISAFLLFVNVIPKKQPHVLVFILFAINFSALFFAVFMALVAD